MRPTLIVVALDCEARPLLSRFGLKRCSGDAWRMYEGNGITLVVSGVGRVRSAMALSALLAAHPEPSRAMLWNIGICGATPGLFEKGRLVMIQCVTNVATSRCWYPDILLIR